MALISATGLGWRLPDGRTLFSDLDFHIGPGPARMALVGANGIGKSTLLKIVAGRIPPSEGVVAVTGSSADLPQDLSRVRAGCVAAALGLEVAWEAWKRVRSGKGLESDMDLPTDAWDIEDRISRILREAGLANWDPDRPCSELSGGEMLRLVLAGLKLGDPDILLLDEPTNHLDGEAREEFLGMAVYGGGYDFYAERKKNRGCGRRGRSAGPGGGLAKGSRGAEAVPGKAGEGEIALTRSL